MTRTNESFWKTIALTMTHLFFGLIGGIIMFFVAAHTPILSYYHDAAIIDKRLADLEDRVDRNDARIEGRWTKEWEKDLQLDRKKYQPLLNGANRLDK